MPADLAQVAWSRLNVSKTWSLAIWILDEIGEAIGTGNRVGDACGDNAQLGASGAGKSGRRVASTRGLTFAKSAARPSHDCFFRYNRANSRTVSRPIGVSTNVGGRSQRP
jgi:hypothetical protein